MSVDHITKRLSLPLSACGLGQKIVVPSKQYPIQVGANLTLFEHISKSIRLSLRPKRKGNLANLALHGRVNQALNSYSKCSLRVLRETKEKIEMYSVVVRLLFLKYLWVHFLVMTSVPLIIIVKLVNVSITMFVILWFLMSAFFTWLLSRWTPLEDWYKRNASKLAGRE